MSDEFLTPTLDWSDMIDAEMLEVVFASRKRWEFLKIYFEYQSRPSETSISAISHLSRIITYMKKCESLCARRNDNILMVWLKENSFLHSFAHLMQVHKLFVEKDAQEHATRIENGSTWVDIFDIEVALDSFRKLIQHGLDKGILKIEIIRFEFKECVIVASQIDPKILEAYRSKVASNG